MLGFRSYATEVTFDPTMSVSQSLSRASTLYKTYKPVTPGIRHLRRPLNPHLWEGRPIRELTVALRKKGGRNNSGRITIRHRGGGHRRRIRLVDFVRKEPGPHDVIRVEYDPNRSAHIALIKNRDSNVEGIKKWSYILATEGLRAGHVVESFRQGIPDGLVPGYADSKEERAKAATKTVNADGVVETSSASLAIGVLRSLTIKPGNVVPLRLIPPGTIINSITLQPEGRGILVRSAGSFGQVVSHEEDGKYTHVKLQSGEIRKVLQECCATIGKVSNPLWKNRSLGKAGRSRWLGRRPKVRGMAMNRLVASLRYICSGSPSFLVGAITLTVVDVVNRRVTNTLVQFGDGTQRVNERGSPVQRVRRTATRWLFTRDLEVKKRELINIPNLHPLSNTLLTFLLVILVLVRLSFFGLRVFSLLQVTNLVPPFRQLFPDRVFCCRNGDPQTYVMSFSVLHGKCLSFR
jgi:ribosomal protein L2